MSSEKIPADRETAPRSRKSAVAEKNRPGRRPPAGQTVQDGVRRPDPGQWAPWILLGGGVFTGSFWLIVGFLNVLDQHASWWQYCRAVVPGSAVLLLVLQAVHAPLPFGSALMVLGVLPFCFWHSPQGLWLRLAFGLPLILLGAGFILDRKRPHIRPEER